MQKGNWPRPQPIPLLHYTSLPIMFIIHTNDMHGRQTHAVLERLGRLREEFPDALLLDAGDAVTAGNLGFRVGGEPVLEAMSDVGYQAMCLGNRETHPRKEILPRKLDRARFPLLSANMIAKGGAPLPVRPHVVLEAGRLRVGVFGVTVQMFTRKQWSQALCDYWFEDPIATARRQAAELRPQVDLLVALTHIGFRKDQELAQACPEVDLVIGGHSHTDLEEPFMAGGVPIVQARAFAFYAGIACLEPHGARVRLVSWEKRPLRDDLPEIKK